MMDVGVFCCLRTSTFYGKISSQRVSSFFHAHDESQRKQNILHATLFIILIRQKLYMTAHANVEPFGAFLCGKRGPSLTISFLCMCNSYTKLLPQHGRSGRDSWSTPAVLALDCGGC